MQRRPSHGSWIGQKREKWVTPLGHVSYQADILQTAMAAFAAEETDDPTASNNAQAQAAAGNTATNAPVPLRRAALTKQALSHLQPPRPASAPLPEHRQHQSPDYASSPLVDKSNESRSKPMMSSTPASPDPAQQNQWQPTPTPHFASSSSSTPSASSSSVLPRQPFFNPNNASTAGSSSSRKVHHSPVRSTSTAHGVNVPQSTFNPAIPALPHAGMPFTTTTQHVSVGSKRALVDYEMADDSTPPATAARNAPGRAAKRRSMGTGVLSKSIEEGGDSDGNQRDRDRDRDRDGHRERRRGGKRNGGAGGVGTA